MVVEADLLARIERLERDTRMLKRACALLLALLAAGVLIIQLVLSAHVKEDKELRVPTQAAPARH